MTNKLSKEIEENITEFFKNLAQTEETFRAEIQKCREMLAQVESGEYDSESIKTKLAILQSMANLYKTAASSSIAIERLQVMKNTGKMLTSAEIEVLIRQMSLIALKFVPLDKQMEFLSEMRNISTGLSNE